MRRTLLTFLALSCLALTSCESGGHFSVFGYTTKPNYDPCIKTVYVPIFQNSTFYRGMEFDLTRAVVKEIEMKTPFKVVSDRDKADTELTGTIVAFTKQILNRNQLNEVREAEQVLTVGVVWKDLRSGEILSQPRVPLANGQGDGPLPPLSTGPSVAPTAANPSGSACPPQPVIVAATGTFAPEIGQSTTSGQQVALNRLANQIVQLMEKPW